VLVFHFYDIINSERSDHMETKFINNIVHVEVYNYFGWGLKSSEETTVRGKKKITHKLTRNIKEDQRVQLIPLENKADSLLKIADFWNRNFNDYWFNNAILSFTTLLIFLLVGSHHGFYETSSFTLPFIRDLFLWIIGAYIFLYLGFYLLKLFIAKKLQKRLVAIITQAKAIRP